MGAVDKHYIKCQLNTMFFLSLIDMNGNGSDLTQDSRDPNPFRSNLGWFKIDLDWFGYQCVDLR